MTIELTKEEKEALLHAIGFFLSHDCVIYNCEKEIESINNKLDKVVQPERLSEEDTVTKCKECGREFLPDCICDSPH